jgi:hypothetical protein
MTPARTLTLSIGVAVLGVWAVVAFHSVAGDSVGGALAVGALVAITRSVIRLAGEAPSEPSGSSHEATSRFRRGS